MSDFGQENKKLKVKNGPWLPDPTAHITRENAHGDSSSLLNNLFNCHSRGSVSSPSHPQTLPCMDLMVHPHNAEGMGNVIFASHMNTVSHSKAKI
jgi:hypothetical protein